MPGLPDCSLIDARMGLVQLPGSAEGFSAGTGERRANSKESDVRRLSATCRPTDKGNAPSG